MVDVLVVISYSHSIKDVRTEGEGGCLNADRGGWVIDDADVRKKHYIG